MKKVHTNSDLQNQLTSLESLLAVLKTKKSESEKIELLKTRPVVKKFFKDHPEYNIPSPHHQYLIISLLALHQDNVVAALCKRDKLIDTLSMVESFYRDLGGIIGYHTTILKLLLEERVVNKTSRYEKPPGIDISQDTPEVRLAIRRGIEELHQICEIYPVGGAGDRLKLCDPKTNEPLPAAQLAFLGRPLFAGMIRDLQAREHLYYKLKGKQLVTPIVMMTSHEKHNHDHMHAICIENRWFSRPKDHFFFFTQPLVPVITAEGDWMVSSPESLLLKPGGHGVLWKLALEVGMFDWAASHDRFKALIRQINNPMAGVDNGLLAFSGIGISQNKTFGFCSCNRLLNASEGMDVLIEDKSVEGFEYRISNVEYTDFAKNGIRDAPEVEGSPYSKYPANTNILFADLPSIRSIIAHNPIPGLLVNMKTALPAVDQHGCLKKVCAGRLESTMQNIADSIIDKSRDHLRTFVTYNKRCKTISVTKKSFVKGGSIQETPEGCFYELLQNHHDLFSKHCKMELPEIQDDRSYLKEGPSFIIHYHPALGPLYSVIAQKVRGGKLAPWAELQLEVAEVELCEVSVDGSLVIEAEHVLGGRDEAGIVSYGNQQGRCCLKNVTVKNRGIDRKQTHEFWRNKIEREESLKIHLRGNAEFVAEDVVFEGAFFFDVLDGHRLTVRRGATGKIERESQSDSLVYSLEKIEGPSWYWEYAFDAEDRIVLTKKF